MKYQEYRPVPALREYVECFWTITGQNAALINESNCVAPDGGIEIVLSFADPMRLGKRGEDLCLQPSRIVIGQLEQGAETFHTGLVDYLGIRFRPEGAFVFLSIPLCEITGQILPLDTLVPALDREIASRLWDAQSTPARIQILQEILIRHRPDSKKGSALVSAAVSEILETHGSTSISELMNRFEISSRQLERQFQHFVGLSPKLLSRIVRFQKIMRAAEQSKNNNWAELALIAGYYDQAHMIQDFRQFTGLSPTGLFTPGWYEKSRVERL